MIFVICISYSGTMKNNKFSKWTIMGLLLFLVVLVLVFPVLFDNEQVYRIILYSATGIVFILMILVISVQMSGFHTGKKRVPE